MNAFYEICEAILAQDNRQTKKGFRNILKPF